MQHWYREKHDSSPECADDPKTGQSPCYGPLKFALTPDAGDITVNPADRLFDNYANQPKLPEGRVMRYLESGTGPNCACPGVIEVDVQPNVTIYDAELLIFPNSEWKGPAKRGAFLFLINCYRTTVP